MHTEGQEGSQDRLFRTVEDPRISALSRPFGVGVGVSRWQRTYETVQMRGKGTVSTQGWALALTPASFWG